MRKNVQLGILNKKLAVCFTIVIHLQVCPTGPFSVSVHRECEFSCLGIFWGGLWGFFVGFLLGGGGSCGLCLVGMFFWQFSSTKITS